MVVLYTIERFQTLDAYFKATLCAFFQLLALLDVGRGPSTVWIAIEAFSKCLVIPGARHPMYGGMAWCMVWYHTETSSTNSSRHGKVGDVHGGRERDRVLRRCIEVIEYHSVE